MLESSSKRVLVDVIEKTGADGRSVIAVLGNLLGYVGSADPRPGFFAGRVVAV